MQKYVVEALGACILTLAVAFAIAGGAGVPVPVVAGMTLGLLVYGLGSVSGTHINPAVTIGLWSIKKIDWQEAILYIVSQFVGAAIAWFALRYFLATPLGLSSGNTLPIGLAECIGAIVFGMGIAAVVYGKVPNDFTGTVIGGSLTLGVVIAAYASNGILNPAVALGLGSFSLMYALAPIVGMVLGMQLYRWLVRESR